MSEPRSESSVRRIGDWCLIALFCVVLALPTLDWILHLDYSPTPNENRTPAVFPAWDRDGGSLQSFLGGLEAWFNDNFGFRKKLVGMHNRWTAKFFGASSSSDVLVGRDGWLYFGGGRMIDNHLGARTLSRDDLQAWQLLLETRRDWLARRGIGYVFVVAPNKETIYPEHLPEWMAPTGKETKLDQFVAFMRAHSSVEVLDLRPVLIAAKSTALTYFPTDSHWNDFGAFLACQELVRRLGPQLPGGVDALPIDAFELELVEQSAGDLAKMDGGRPVSHERTTPQLTPLQPLHPLEAREATSLPASSGMADRVPVFTERPGQRHRVVLFRDSFATAWYPFLGQHFARVVYVLQYPWSAALIEREHPDIVVDEVVERHLNEGDPRELLERDALTP